MNSLRSGNIPDLLALAVFLTHPGLNPSVEDAGEVLEYDGQDGSFVAALVAAAANGGLDAPRGLTFKPDGNLLVASYGTDEVLEFDGATGM